MGIAISGLPGPGPGERAIEIVEGKGLGHCELRGDPGVSKKIAVRCGAPMTDRRRLLFGDHGTARHPSVSIAEMVSGAPASVIKLDQWPLRPSPLVQTFGFDPSASVNTSDTKPPASAAKRPLLELRGSVGPIRASERKYLREPFVSQLTLSIFLLPGALTCINADSPSVRNCRLVAAVY